MSKDKYQEAPRSGQQPRSKAALSAGVIELACGQRYQVRLLSGELVEAGVSAGCKEELAAECLRHRRTVMLADSEHGPVILGALQTEPTAARESADGVLQLKAPSVRLQGDESIAIEVGKSRLELCADGQLRIAGQRLSMDVAALIRLLSSRVELP